MVSLYSLARGSAAGAAHLGAAFTSETEPSPLHSPTRCPALVGSRISMARRCRACSADCGGALSALCCPCCSARRCTQAPEDPWLASCCSTSRCRSMGLREQAWGTAATLSGRPGVHGGCGRGSRGSQASVREGRRACNGYSFPLSAEAMPDGLQLPLEDELTMPHLLNG